MPNKTMIYGSGAMDANSREGVARDPRETAGEDAMATAKQLASNPLTLPLAPLAMLVSSLQQGAAGLGGPMGPRRFSPSGKVVPTWTTNELYRKSFFGEG